MDTSPASERRAQMIREMAQDLNKTRQSLGSNSDFADLTGSQLSVEEESSQAYNSQLPQLGHANRSSRFASRPSQDFVIDTSAIGRAFPDMTGSGSSIDDGSSISIEIGRGGRNGTRNLSDDGDSTGMGGRYKVDLSKLPRRTFSSGRPLQDVSTNIESIRSSPPPKKATRYGTSGSSQESREERRQAPPKVTVEDAQDNTGSTGSGLSQNATVRSARFGRGQLRDTLAPPKRFTSTKDFLQTVDEPTARVTTANRIARTPVDNLTLTTANGGTVQSFMLPNVPNMSELVSGVYDDGTPVFSRKGTGRFSSRHKSPAVKHAAIPSIPVPQDEDAIVLSLQLLQEKVAELEKNKAEAQVLVHELQDKNRGLENEKKAWRRSSRKYDSGMGSSAGSEAGDDRVHDGSKAALERDRLKINLRNLQHELDGANRRAAIAEANINNVTQERDAAVSQLGIAFITQEELKVDNEALKEENKRLELDIKKYRAAIEAYIQRAELEKTENEKTEMSKGKGSDEERTGGEVGSLDCQVLDVDTPKRPNTRRETSRSDLIREKEPTLEIPKRRKRRIIVEEYTATSEFAGFDDQERQELEERIQDGSRNVSRNLSRNLPRNISQSQRPATRAESRHREQPATRAESRELRDEDPKDLTQASHVSFLQDGDVTMLRKMLEQEHLMKKGRVQPSGASRQNQDLTGDITQLTQHTSRSRGLPRKSSMKDLTGRLSSRVDDAVESDGEVERTHHSRAPSQTRRRHSDASVATKASRGQVPAMEDMTSAFILPDITMNVRQRRASQANADLTKAMSVAAPEIVISSAPHETSNCTICTRLRGNCPHGDGEDEAEVKIPQPIPVTDRINDLALDGEDHTARPSEPPAEALARTIKSLEDEFAHMGLQIAELQNIYNELDPSLQKRKRKSLGERIDKLRNAMDAKADQIYALYDVLEGQKKAGKINEMTEQELNETLTSVLGDGNLGNLGMPNGIMFKRGLKTSTADVTPAKEKPKPMKRTMSQETKRRTPKPAAGAEKFPWDESYDDEDAESLPWEGFDDTLDLTQGSRRSNTSSRRRSIGL